MDLFGTYINFMNPRSSYLKLKGLMSRLNSLVFFDLASQRPQVSPINGIFSELYLFIYLFYFFVVSAFEVTEGILLLYAATSYNTDQERVWEVGDCGPIA